MADCSVVQRERLSDAPLECQIAAESGHHDRGNCTITALTRGEAFLDVLDRGSGAVGDEEVGIKGGLRDALSEELSSELARGAGEGGDSVGGAESVDDEREAAASSSSK